MKLVNYKLGYMFDCSIHGTVKMNRKEYDQVVKLLYSKITDPFYKDILYKDLASRINIKNGFVVSVRVPATEMIVKKFGLSNYKRANYILKVVN